MAEIVHVLVSGQVQGVGYREFARTTAQRLGIAGWVRNLPDGDVELLARIPPGRKAAFLAQLRQGPRMAEVADVIVTPAMAGADCPEAGFTGPVLSLVWMACGRPGTDDTLSIPAPPKEFRGASRENPHFY